MKVGLKFPDGRIITKTMSDWKWDWLCLTDRLFHPEKYQEREDVESTVEKIIERLKKYCQDESFLSELFDFVNQIKNLNIPKEVKNEVEKDILKQIAETYS